MAMVHAGLAKHGNAWFSAHQTEGKGQRGKAWSTGKDDNIALSIVLTPRKLNIIHPFQLSTAVALASFDFFHQFAGDKTTIKWPNDIYWGDRKAGGILIENKFSGNDWNWAVVGIGFNINQIEFDPQLVNPISLSQATGQQYDLPTLTEILHRQVMARTEQFLTKSYASMLAEYNSRLYQLNKTVKLRKGSMVFDTLIKGVAANGQLITHDVIEKSYGFGEVEWVFD